MLDKNPIQTTYKIMSWLVIAIIAFLAFFDYRYEMQPCILSYLERMILLTLALLFWTGSLYHQSNTAQKRFGWIGILLNILGIATVIRHLWIQRAATYEFSYFDPGQPLMLTLKQMVKGIAPGCSQIYKVFLGIRITEILLAVFILFLLICFFQRFRKI